MLTGALCIPLKKNTNPKILKILSAIVNKKGLPKLKVCTVHPLKKAFSRNPKYKIAKIVEANMPL
jgi:hypothetical protein